MSNVGDRLERDFNEYVASLDSDYTVSFGYAACYIVVLYRGSLVEEKYIGEGRWRSRRRQLRRIIRGHRKFLATASAEGAVVR